MKTIEYLINDNKFRIIVNNKIIELNKYNDMSNIKESFEESENDDNLNRYGIKHLENILIMKMLN